MAQQVHVDNLPDDTLVFLLGSRYCETDRLSETAWKLFGQTPTGWSRVQAICDFVHHHIAFGYEYARPTMTAFEAFVEKRGVCRDFTHLAVALCRCMRFLTPLQRLRERYRGAAALCAYGFRSLVRSLPGWRL